MVGMAQKLFKAETGKFAVLPKKQCKAALHDFAFLDGLIENYKLNPIDVRLSHTLLKTHSLKSEAVSAFVAHLSLSTRNGHLLVKLEEGQILPSVASLWKSESSEISDADIKTLEKLIFDGFNEIQTTDAFAKLFANPDEKFPTSYLCKFENMIYFQRYFIFETTVLESLKRLEKTKPILSLNEDLITQKVNLLLQKKVLLKEQAESILKATKQTLTFISGGPGTGKTYTAGYLLRIILESLSDEAKKEIKIGIAAPTGKAASNLQNSLGHEFKDRFKAKTLHSLLGIKENGKLKQAKQTFLAFDIILVDESSMIDAAMMARLLSSVKPGARIIFLGDQYQLPSVDAGALFADLVKLLPNQSVMLQKCLRAELQEIVDFGQAINTGNSDKVFEMLEEGVAITRLKNLELKQEALFQYASSHFPIVLKNNSTPEEILESFNKFRILSPLRKGLFGVDSLNHYFFQHLVKKHLKNSPVMIPIMLLRNESNLELFNGEVGVLVLHPCQDGENAFIPKINDYALFACKKNGFRRLPALVLPQYEYAYCLSIHKAQGSEFDHVLCLLPEGSEHFGREVLYTAVTRVRKKLEIFGEDEIMKKTIENRSERLSGIAKRMHIK